MQLQIQGEAEADI